MTGEAVARRYAVALLRASARAGAAEAVAERYQQAADEFRANARLRALLASPGVPLARKKELLGELASGQELLQRFFQLLAERRRVGLLPLIYESFRRLLDEEEGVTVVRIRSPQVLSEALRGALREKLTAALGREVRLQEEVEPELLAGLILEIGDRRWDGSLPARLRGLGQALKGAAARKEG